MTTDNGQKQESQSRRIMTQWLSQISNVNQRDYEGGLQGHSWEFRGSLKKKNSRRGWKVSSSEQRNRGKLGLRGSIFLNQIHSTSVSTSFKMDREPNHLLVHCRCKEYNDIMIKALYSHCMIKIIK